jgi:diguanylate cyclase (GGDEF)-like protein
VSLALAAAVAAGILIGWLAARALASRQPPAAAPGSPRSDPRADLPDVADVMGQMLAASGRRSMVPVILKQVVELLDPEQAAVFVSRPDGKLALADGMGLPESLGRGAEIEAGQGRIGRVAQGRQAFAEADFQAEGSAVTPEPGVLAGLRVDVAAPIVSYYRLHGVVCLGRPRRRPEDAKAILKMLADLGGLAILQVDKLKAVQDTANVDGLTGVFNKRYFQERLSTELRRAERDGQGATLLLLDIDHFKNYNDTNGHVAGDEVLKKVGHILKHSVREDDVVARYGGEEFVILYPGVSKALAYKLAQGIRRSVETQAFPGAERQPLGAVTLSGGVAAFPQDATTEVELIRAADHALYQAKKAGRNRIIGAGASDPTRAG